MNIDQQEMTDWLKSIFTVAGCPEEEAVMIGTHLVDADASGHASHGIARVPRYIDYIKQGDVRPVCEAVTLMQQGPLLLVDGQYSFGQVLGHQIVDKAVELTAEHGLALIGLRNAGHLGRIGGWAEELADKNLISIHFVTVAGSCIVAPFGAKQSRISTAPVAIGVPHYNADGSTDHYILDFATSRVAEGKILVSQKTGSTLPSDAMVDENGQDSDNPRTIYGPSADSQIPNPRGGEGAIQTFGDHKGSGLGLACELLAGALTGAGTNAIERKFCNGLLSIVLDPKKFDTDSAMVAEIDAFIASIRDAEPRVEGQAVVIPGDPERRRRAHVAEHGINLDETIRDQLVLISDELGVAVPSAAL